MSEYTYSCSRVSETVAMIRRTKESGTWDEALLSGEEYRGLDANQLIAAAIEKGSWA